jgi:hypothetical protein
MQAAVGEGGAEEVSKEREIRGSNDSKGAVVVAEIV